jgi:hypothetical protein
MTNVNVWPVLALGQIMDSDIVAAIVQWRHTNGMELSEHVKDTMPNKNFTSHHSQQQDSQNAICASTSSVKGQLLVASVVASCSLS